jgi:hypothetical protein
MPVVGFALVSRKLLNLSALVSSSERPRRLFVRSNRSSRQPASLSSLATRRANFEVCLALGVLGLTSLQITSSAQA